MTTKEIKKRHPMSQIVRQYGFKPNRAGFISCPFHTGDNTPSLKIYEDSFHCFACGANGDIFVFVQKMESCDFKTAYLALGGSYEKMSDKKKKQAIRDAMNARRAREKEEERKLDLKAQLNEMAHWIDCLRYGVQHFEPLSEEWCFCMNELETVFYKYDAIRQEID